MINRHRAVELYFPTKAESGTWYTPVQSNYDQGSNQHSKCPQAVGKQTVQDWGMLEISCQRQFADKYAILMGKATNYEKWQKHRKILDLSQRCYTVLYSPR